MYDESAKMVELKKQKNGLTQRKAAEASEGHITTTQPATVCQVL